MTRIRWNKLPKSRLQMRLIAVFLTLTCVAATLQLFLIHRALISLSDQLPTDGDLVIEAMPATVFEVLLWTVGLMVPVIVCAGAVVTFRIAGPIHRIEEHLRAVLAGTAAGPCRLRERDELRDLCNLVNRAIDCARREGVREPQTDAAPEPSAGSAGAALDSVAAPLVPEVDPEPVQHSGADPSAVHDCERGFAIITALLTLMLLVIAVLTTVTQFVMHSKEVEQTGEDQHLTVAAESASELAMHDLWSRFRSDVATARFANSVAGFRDFLGSFGIEDSARRPVPPFSLLSFVALDLDADGKSEIDGIRIESLDVVRRDLGAKTELVFTTTTGGRLRQLGGKHRGWSRVIEATFDIEPERFNGLDYTLLANNINCILCHTTVDSAHRYFNLDPGRWNTFDRVRVGTIEHLQMRGSADSRVHGTIYSSGPVTDKNGNPITDWASHSLRGAAFASGGKIAQDALGRVVEIPLSPVADSAIPFGNLYPEYGRHGPMGDGPLPTSFPPPFPDDGGVDGNGKRISVGAGNRRVDRGEFDAVTRAFHGSISGGRIFVLPAGGRIDSPADLTPALRTSSTSRLGSITEGQVFLTGTTDRPILLDGDVGIWGNLVIRGVVRGRGAIYVSENAYAPVDVTYLDGEDHNGKRRFGVAADDTPNLLAVTAGGNVLIGDPLHPNRGVGTVTSGSNGKMSFTLMELALFNRSEWVKTRPELPGAGQTVRTPPASWSVTNPLYQGPKFVPRYYAFTAGMDVGIANLFGHFDAEGTWIGPELPRKWDTDLTRADPSDTGDPILYPGNGIEPVISYVTAGDTWISDEMLDELIDESFRGRSDGPLRIDMFSYSSNAIFGIVSRHSRNTGGELVINGGVVAADVGLLATQGSTLRYDDRARRILNIAGSEQAVVARASMRTLR